MHETARPARKENICAFHCSTMTERLKRHRLEIVKKTSRQFTSMANEQGRQAAQASRLPSSCTYDGVGDGVVVAAEAMLAAATLVASCKSKRFIGAFYFPPIPDAGKKVCCAATKNFEGRPCTAVSLGGFMFPFFIRRFLIF